MKKVIITRPFRKIGDYVFQDCTNLEKIKKFEQVSDFPLELGDYAFSGCSKLTFPSASSYDVDKIGMLGVGSFEKCTSLKIDQMLFSSNWISCDLIPDKCFMGCTEINGLVSLGKVKYVGKEAFKDCVNLRCYKDFSRNN